MKLICHYTLCLIFFLLHGFRRTGRGTTQNSRAVRRAVRNFGSAMFTVPYGHKVKAVFEGDDRYLPTAAEWVYQ